MQGGPSIAGGIGAVAGELAAKLIREQLYGKDVKDLTEAEKQNISALAQLAAGLAIAAGGGDTGAAGAAIAAGKNAVENNALNTLDLYKSEIEKDLDEVERAKRLFGGDEDKAWEYVLAKKQAEASGVIDGVIESLEGTVNTVLHPIDTVVGIYDAISNPDKVYEAIKVTATEWQELYDYALKNDPALAGEMMGHLEGKIVGEVGTGYVISGASAKVIQKIANLKYVSNSINKIDNIVKNVVTKEETGIKWREGIKGQGMPWEGFVGKELPAGSRLPENFKTFDY